MMYYDIIVSFAAPFTNPFGETFLVFPFWGAFGRGGALAIFAARLTPFVVFGVLIAIGLSLRRRIVGWHLLRRVIFGAWIGVMVGCTYYAIVSIAAATQRFATVRDCVAVPTSKEIWFISPYMNATLPREGATCMSVSIGAIAFFAVFIAVGIGTAYIAGRNEGARKVSRLIVGAVYGLLTAGTIMPLLVVYDVFDLYSLI